MKTIIRDIVPCFVFLFIIISCEDKVIVRNYSPIELDLMCEKIKTNKEKQFDSIKVGNQIWMTKNLNVVTFRNGDSIFNAQTNEEWIQATENRKPAWCYYNNDKALGEKYGLLYNWYAIDDYRGLAPFGWRVPSLKDFKQLEIAVKGFRQRGVNNDSKGEWLPKLEVNQIGFQALPAGGRFREGEFRHLEEAVYFWSCTEKDNPYDNNTLGAHMLMFNPVFSMIAYYPKEYGLSIRCVR